MITLPISLDRAWYDLDKTSIPSTSDENLKSVIFTFSEFGRRVKQNTSQGTDHGTASCLILAGGAVRPGGLLGDWPTLADNRLYEGRDLTPTLDVRSVFKGLLRDHLGLDQTDIERTVFPNSGEAAAVSGLV